MSLESGNYISDLVASNPQGTDPVSQGDDHIRLIKDVLKKTLPDANGAIHISPNSLKVGQNADPSKNFLISTPKPEDGTLTIEREDGTDVMTVDAAGKVSLPGGVNGFKQKKLTFTSPAAGTSIGVAHGLDPGGIVGLQCFIVDDVGGANTTRILPGQENAAYALNTYFDNASCYLRLNVNAPSTIQGTPGVFLITYEA